MTVMGSLVVRELHNNYCSGCFLLNQKTILTINPLSLLDLPVNGGVTSEVLCLCLSAQVNNDIFKLQNHQ